MRVMRPVDLERFWHDNDRAAADPFDPAIARPPLGIHMGYESVFAELGEPYDPLRLEREPAYATRLAAAYNERALRIVGRRLLGEHDYDSHGRPPALTPVAQVCGCRREHHAGSWWDLPAADTPAELERLLDRIEKMLNADDLRATMLPPHFDALCRHYEQRRGRKPVWGKWQRGPVTLATNIYGSENLIYLILDAPVLAARFRDVITRLLIAYFSVVAELNEAQDQPGFAFLDDNCALLNPDMYAFFGQPILRAVFERFAPDAGHLRYQHSDSNMSHLLPLLAQTGLTRVNFGPTLRVAEIRAAMPDAVIEGQLSPLTFMSNDEEAIIAEVRRDIDQARPRRGLVVATAGSVNNGTRLTSLRAVMHAIQTWGRY